MHNVIVVSDIHGDLDLLDVIKKRHKIDNPTYINLGDSCLDEDSIADMINVKGNCDDIDFPIYKTLSLGGIDMLLTHGHTCSVKLSLDKLYDLANDYGVSLVLYGHTHVVKKEKIGEINFINPGSTTKPKRLFKYNGQIRTIPTYLWMTIKNAKVEYKFLNALNGREINF